MSAARRRDPLIATAAPAERWLLLEQPGPWGRDAVRQSLLDPALGDALERRVHAVRGRLVLVRRPDRARWTGPRWWAWADARSGHERLVEGTVGDPAELLQLPLDDPPGPETAEPLWLVCTHGGHDACCAVAGRPTLAALIAARPGRVWACSHLGGDRFAANVVVLPQGLGYGRVQPADAEELTDRHDAGRVRLDLLRGRSALPAPAQAAEQLVREQLGEDRLDALVPVHVKEVPGTEPDTWRVVLRSADGGELVATVQSATSDTAELLTCAAVRPAHHRTWLLRHMER